MSHQHFCDYTGHVWTCAGMARRPLAGQPYEVICLCLLNQILMNEEDHSGCPIELLACEEHCEQQLLEMNLHHKCGALAGREPAAESKSIVDERGRGTVGLCIWCDLDFYTKDEVNEHNADDMSAYPVFLEFNQNDAESATFEE